ncbi:hypothetical protein AYI70_g7100 [Smittium culicis]|uniref:Uncharacterized protein n=1 Tax=Smittium culicis TaxID=133412 RepID=A0A1R1XM35_9FUNG|nr:hypothetical protein AYI70_g7100 [Smittium culicis]
MYEVNGNRGGQSYLTKRAARTIYCALATDVWTGSGATADGGERAEFEHVPAVSQRCSISDRVNNFGAGVDLPTAGDDGVGTERCGAADRCAYRGRAQ